MKIKTKKYVLITNNLDYKKNSIQIIIFIAIVTFMFAKYPMDLHKGKYLWQPLGIALLTIIAFYTHSIKLLPLLLRDRKIKKYVLLTVAGLVIYYFTSSWFQALYTYEAGLTRHIDGTPIEPLAFFLNKKSFVEYLMVMPLPLILFGLLSLIYYIFIINK